MTENDSCFSLSPPRPTSFNVSVQEWELSGNPSLNPRPLSLSCPAGRMDSHTHQPQREAFREIESRSVPSWALQLPRSALAKSLLTATGEKREEAWPGHAGCQPGCRGRSRRPPCCAKCPPESRGLLDSPSCLPWHPIQHQVLPAAPPGTSGDPRSMPSPPGFVSQCHLSASDSHCPAVSSHPLLVFFQIFSTKNPEWPCPAQGQDPVGAQ